MFDVRNETSSLWFQDLPEHEHRQALAFGMLQMLTTALENAPEELAVNALQAGLLAAVQSAPNLPWQAALQAGIDAIHGRLQDDLAGEPHGAAQEEERPVGEDAPGAPPQPPSPPLPNPPTPPQGVEAHGRGKIDFCHLEATLPRGLRHQSKQLTLCQFL